MEAIPSIMRGAALDGFGEPGVLTIHRLPVPVPDAHGILIAVHTAGVGTWDVDLRAGWWPEGKRDRSGRALCSTDRSRHGARQRTIR
jgi:D-arabinose 1-dehydrogenase-like Zn-dependent alcohol dehydrogenase